MKSSLFSRRFLWLLAAALFAGGLALCAKDKAAPHPPLTLQLDPAAIDRNAPEALGRWKEMAQRMRERAGQPANP